VSSGVERSTDPTYLTNKPPEGTIHEMNQLYLDQETCFQLISKLMISIQGTSEDEKEQQQHKLKSIIMSHVLKTHTAELSLASVSVSFSFPRKPLSVLKLIRQASLVL